MAYFIGFIVGAVAAGLAGFLVHDYLLGELRQGVGVAGAFLREKSQEFDVWVAARAKSEGAELGVLWARAKARLKL